MADKPGTPPPTDPKAPLPEIGPELEQMAQAAEKLNKEISAIRQAAYNSLIAGYEDIAKRAAENKPISADDFAMVEAAYNKAMVPAIKDFRELNNLNLHSSLAVMRQVIHETNEHKIDRFANTGVAIHAMKDAFTAREKALDEAEKKSDPAYGALMATINPASDAKKLDNVEALNRAFEREYLEKPLHEKNLKVPVNVTDPSQLVDQLLAHNRGLAIGDMHSFAGSASFISGRIQMLKRDGVDTIYIEADEDMRKMMGFSAAELHRLAKEGAVKGVRIRSPEEIGTTYKSGFSGNTDIDMAEMMAAAKENNIRIVNMDKTGEARNIEKNLSLSHRVASTNFEWADTIEKDRLEMDKGKNTPGKFIVFAGEAHMTGDPAHPEQQIGMVANVLGIPSICFDRRESNLPGFHKSNTPSGADFYVFAGDQYPRNQMGAYAQDIANAAAALPADPLLNPLKTQLEGLAHQFQAMFNKSLQQVPPEYQNQNLPKPPVPPKQR